MTRQDMTTRRFREFCRDTDGELGVSEGGKYACRYTDPDVSNGAVFFDPEAETFEIRGEVRVFGVPEEAVGFNYDETGDFMPGVNVGTEELQEVYRSIGFDVGVPTG